MMFYECTHAMTPVYWQTLLTWSFIVFTLCSANLTTGTSTVRVVDGITEASVTGHYSSNNSRAINSTGLWSKYNLIVKPSVVTATKNYALGPSTTPEPRYRPVDIPQEDDDDDRDEFADDSDDTEDSQEEEDAAEEDDYYATSTTQRTSHRPPQHKRKPKPPPAQIVHVIPQRAPVKPLVAPLHPAKIKGGKLRKTRKKTHIKLKGLKKLKKYMLPLLLAYKLKFFTLIPLLLGGLVVIVTTTGFAGFFFALFAVGVGLKKD